MEDILREDLFEGLDADLLHYGTPRHSGRYPWGSGDNPFQRNAGIYAEVQRMKAEGASETTIKEAMGWRSVEDIRGFMAAEKNARTAAMVAQALRWKDKGMSNVAIGERLGIAESSVRSLLGPATKMRLEMRDNLSSFLKEQVAKNTYVDVGKGTELHIPGSNVSASQLNQALHDLSHEGYQLHNIKMEQVTTGKDTTMLVLTPPDTTWADTMAHRADIRSVAGWTDNGGETFNELKQPVLVDSDRIQVAYDSVRDGVIQIRRGVEDLNMGNASYAQVRILTDTGVPDDKTGSTQRYLKGMAVYADDLPAGVDILYHSNKSPGTPPSDVFKTLQNPDDLIQPWKADTRFEKQKPYTDADGNERRSALNLVSEEGTWNDWKAPLSSQMLSKQSVELAKKQLGQDYDNHLAEFETLRSLTNPVVRQKLMEDAAGKFDKAAEDLSAAGLPRTSQNVLLPVPSLRENEIYAPRYNQGERVVLIRHPHAGTFEIPELVVNNNNPEARKFMRNAVDAVGINPSVAQQLSGADFDGDTVLVIPNPKREIATSTYPEQLAKFNPKEMYPEYEGMKVMTHRQTQLEMGKISNLITDMTLKGATLEEVIRADKHSMVVIDAEKHHLNWKQSESDQGIMQLKEKYQREVGKVGLGASTIISRAGGEKHVPEIKRFDTDPETGGLIAVESKRTKMIPIKDRSGDVVGYKEVPRTTETTKMADTPDARLLMSDQRFPIEMAYADYANQMKALANETRRQAKEGTPIPYSPSAAKVYASEVDTLNAKLRVAQANKPLERQAQVLANAEVRMRFKSDPDLSPDQRKKIKSQALATARDTVGAKRDKFIVTDNEWKAIQSGAINTTKLRSIMEVADSDRLRELSTPRKSATPDVSIARIQALLGAGLTQAQVAEKLGISVSTVNRHAK